MEEAYSYTSESCKAVCNCLYNPHRLAQEDNTACLKRAANIDATLLLRQWLWQDLGATGGERTRLTVM